MKPRSGVWVRLSVFVAFVLAIVMVGRSAVAGTLEIRDERHVLSAVDIAHLRTVVQAAPFDARLAVTTSFADSRELSRYVGSLLNTGNMIAVGLDPEHHHVQVHFGTASGIPQTAWSDIERAGNDAFRRSDWAGGIETIVRSATASAHPSAGGPVPARSIVSPVFGLLVGAAVIGLLVYFARRSRSYGNYAATSDPNYGYGARPPWGGPGAPYGPPQGGMGPIGGGLIGAGLGGLAGYELGKMEGEREQHAVDDGSRGRAFEEPRDDGFDAGGGGSSWDDGGGGFDGGGSDGSSGGGSDF
ncbi:MAG: hypothetical protein ABTD50_16785 [Polyangiaceae bacterium]